MIRSTMRHTQPICKVEFTKSKKMNEFLFYIFAIRFFSLSLHKISQITFINKQQKLCQNGKFKRQNRIV